MIWLRHWREDSRYKKVYKRLVQQDSVTILLWADSCLWATQEGIQGFRATADRAALEEAQIGALSLLASLDVLLDKVDKVSHP